jgi:hypothetical protein
MCWVRCFAFIASSNCFFHFASIIVRNCSRYEYAPVYAILSSCDLLASKKYMNFLGIKLFINWIPPKNFPKIKKYIIAIVKEING